jgi:hypothetical protein
MLLTSALGGGEWWRGGKSCLCWASKSNAMAFQPVASYYTDCTVLHNEKFFIIYYSTIIFKIPRIIDRLKVNFILGLLHCVAVGNVTNISKVHAGSVFRIGWNSMYSWSIGNIAHNYTV